jgi:two-component system, cell cycle sensor histidine kinase and response regulator CckA
MPDRFREVVATGTRDIFAAIDRSGAVTYVSPAVQTALGLIPTEVVGNIIWELVHPDDVVGVHGIIKSIFEQGGRQHVEFQMVDVNGRWHRLDASVQLLEREPAEAALVATDVTDQRQLEATLRERDDQLRQARKMEVVGRLASGISHDFGNLLTIVIGASGHLLDGLPAESPLRPHAESIRLSATRAASMVRQLLGFGRQRGDEPTILNLNEVVREAEQLLLRLVGEHIEIDTICADDLWEVLADRVQLEQVLLNLGVNARDAMPAGGRVTIETRNAVATSSSRTARPGHEYVVVTVADTGTGMDAATLAQAFEPFFTTKPLGKGTGLGLSTVHNIVRQSGGWTEIESTPGHGTKVIFGLPRASAHVRAVSTKAAPARGGTETILLVEDEDGVRDLVRDMLELAGYRVLVAAVPSDALRISRECEDQIRLLVTDVVMPEMSGLELASTLREHRPSMQVMYMSGYPEPTVGDGTVAAPGAHFVSKPFDRQGLLHAVRRALDAETASR